MATEFTPGTSPQTGSGQVWIENADGVWEIANVTAPGVVHQVFTASGTYTPSPGMIAAMVEVVGGGGGGGGTTDGTDTRGAGAGGGGGGYSRALLSSSQIGASVTVTVGAGGAGGNGTTPTDGSAGGTTSFAADSGTIQATGGGGGDTCLGVADASTSIDVVIGGAGGVGSGGDINAAGSGGGSAISWNDTAVDRAPIQDYGGHGGSSAFGGGAQVDDGDGAAGGNYGGGGAGGLDWTTGTDNDRDGGAGAGGIVIVTEYIRQSVLSPVAYDSTGTALLDLSTDGQVNPGSDDGATLGNSTTAWSDLFLASGGVINWDSGDVTITEGTNQLIIDFPNSGDGTYPSLRVTQSVTDGSNPFVEVYADSSSPAVDDEIGSYVWRGNHSGGGSHVYANFGCFTTNVTDGAEEGRIIFKVSDGGNGNNQVCRMDPDGFHPSSNDNCSLGTSSLKWSDLYLADGGTINWNSSESRITHNTTSGALVLEVDESNAASGSILQIDIDGSNRCYFGTGALQGNSNGSYDLGTSSVGFGELFMASSGNGVSFDGGSNYLDDYEEGTWTPTLANGYTSPTYGAQNGQYIKVGAHVTAWFRINVSGGTSAAADVRIGGLPFNTTTDTNFRGAGCPSSCMTTGMDITGDEGVFFSSGTNSSEFELRKVDAGVQSNASPSGFINGVFTYKTDS